MLATAPPAAAPLLPLDRRTLLKGGLLGAGLAGIPLAAQGAERGFTSGVASGEPAANSVLLWTRYSAGAETMLRWEMAETSDFARIVAGGDASAAPDNDLCCKPVATGLAPGRWYYYRFVAPDGTMSDIGRTRTLPQGRTERFRMAVFSCSNIGFGWFNAYAHAAAADDVDCVLHLGDYIYEYPAGTYPGTAQVVDGRGVEPTRELVALADYRARYAQYHRDPNLRRLRQLFPMIAGQDDHESANDSWEGGAQNHQSATEGPWAVRKAAARRAYREWLPVSDAEWASYEVGDLATLFRLETRLSARAEPFDIGRLLAGKSAPGEAEAALAAFRNGTWRDPARNMIGTDQQAWLAEGLRASRRAGKVWQVLVQQVLMGTLRTPLDVADWAGSDLPDYVRARIASGLAASRAGLPMSMDAWDGYPAARSRIFAAAQAADANLISLAGDTHNAWAFDLAENGAAVGVEFGGHSVTSPGYESAFPKVAPARIATALRETNPGLAFADTSRRGYMAVELTRTAARCEYRFLGNVRQKDTALAGTHTLVTLPGRRTLAAA
ncbi:MAG TPA: alkaline phosphatase D family protein [Qipengyuania sp.]|nr:alkaline phosphatase D family protein [Qipengyuania sp.]